MARHGACVRTNAPTRGAIIGAKPPMAWRSDMVRARRCPRAQSTKIARPTADAAPPPKPWRKRPRSRTQTEGASAQITPPIRQSKPPAIIGRRLPS